MPLQPVFEPEELVLVLDGESDSKGVVRKMPWGGFTSGMDRLGERSPNREVAPDDDVMREGLRLGCSAWLPPTPATGLEPASSRL